MMDSWICWKICREFFLLELVTASMIVAESFCGQS
jgi:hypothetical protein